MVCLLRYMVTEEGLWNLDLLKVWLPDDIIIHIVSIPSPYSFARPDRIDWFKSGSGPQRIQMFIWLALKQRSLTQGSSWGWILGFNKRLGQCSIFNYELWGILDDFTLLQSRQYDKVLIWTNNMEVLQDIEEAFSKTSYSTLIRRIQQLLLEIGQWEFEHIPKEENIEVDYITKLAFDKNEGLQLFVDNLLNFTS
ncbi:hypothetical protein Golob_017964 [Gossypium lobatum]|uniref:RNase H type-1 domain-containing protein n=1 Tax=Gossypium lobatum TaxID=34289 RepID=A0A7J8M985_9ROSI|nr:hypothetical protein [Gossypium lobatum]